MAGLDLVTAPTGEPITVSQARDHIRNDTTEDDQVVGAVIAAARSHVEAFLKQSLMASVWEYRIDTGFPAEIRLPIGPLIDPSTVLISYVDDAGATQTLDSAAYQVSKGSTGVIRPAYGQTWPSTRQQMDAVTVQFTAGVTAAASLPPAIRQAVKMVAAELYENREDSAPVALSQVPLAARNLMIPFVRHD